MSNVGEKIVNVGVKVAKKVAKNKATDVVTTMTGINKGALDFGVDAGGISADVIEGKITMQEGLVKLGKAVENRAAEYGKGVVTGYLVQQGKQAAGRAVSNATNQFYDRFLTQAFKNSRSWSRSTRVFMKYFEKFAKWSQKQVNAGTEVRDLTANEQRFGNLVSKFKNSRVGNYLSEKVERFLGGRIRNAASRISNKASDTLGKLGDKLGRKVSDALSTDEAAEYDFIPEEAADSLEYEAETAIDTAGDLAADTVADTVGDITADAAAEAAGDIAVDAAADVAGGLAADAIGEGVAIGGAEIAGEVAVEGAVGGAVATGAVAAGLTAVPVIGAVIGVGLLAWTIFDTVSKVQEAEKRKKDARAAAAAREGRYNVYMSHVTAGKRHMPHGFIFQGFHDYRDANGDTKYVDVYNFKGFKLYLDEKTGHPMYYRRYMHQLKEAELPDGTMYKMPAVQDEEWRMVDGGYYNSDGIWSGPPGFKYTGSDHDIVLSNKEKKVMNTILTYENQTTGQRIFLDEDTYLPCYKKDNRWDYVHKGSLFGDHTEWDKDTGEAHEVFKWRYDAKYQQYDEQGELTADWYTEHAVNFNEDEKHKNSHTITKNSDDSHTIQIKHRPSQNDTAVGSKRKQDILNGGENLHNNTHHTTTQYHDWHTTDLSIYQPRDDIMTLDEAISKKRKREHPAQFDIKLANFLAEFASEAYKGSEPENKHIKANYHIDVLTCSVCAQAVVYTRKKQCIIAFRGTANLRDAFMDMNLQPLKSRIGTVHSGFWRYYETVLKNLLKDLDEILMGKRRKVYITGHSLGGALAQIFSTEYSKHFPTHPLRACYVFNSPAWGTYDTMSSFNELPHPSWRVYFENDPVSLAFRHVSSDFKLMLAQQISAVFSVFKNNTKTLLYVETKKKCKVIGQARYIIEDTYGTKELNYKSLGPVWNPVLILKTLKDAYQYHRMGPLKKELRLCAGNGMETDNFLEHPDYEIYYL